MAPTCENVTVLGDNVGFQSTALLNPFLSDFKLPMELLLKYTDKKQLQFFSRFIAVSLLYTLRLHSL